MGLLTFNLLAFVFVTLTFFYVTFVLVVTTFATVITGDGTPEMVLMGNCFAIFGVLLSFFFAAYNHCRGRSQGHDKVRPCH